MATKRTRQQAEELTEENVNEEVVEDTTSEEVSTVDTTSEDVKEPTFTFDEFVQRNKGLNPGTVASFKYEARKAKKDLTVKRPKAEWVEALNEQSKRAYKPFK